MNTELKDYMTRGLVWRALDRTDKIDLTINKIATGYSELDSHLNGGWPEHALIELLLTQQGCGELRILLTLCLSMSHESEVIFVNPPSILNGFELARQGMNLSQLMIINTKSLVETLWTVQQCLLSNVCSLVMAWLPTAVPMQSIKKLRVACRETKALCFLLRPKYAAKNPSAANIRLLLQPLDIDSVVITVIKQKGCTRAERFTVRLRPSLASLKALANDRWPVSLIKNDPVINDAIAYSTDISELKPQLN